MTIINDNYYCFMFNKVVYNIAKKEIEKLYFRLEKEGESKIPGLMEQWLREKRLCEEEIVNEASHTFFVGVDTVCYASFANLHELGTLTCIIHTDG